MNESIVKKIFLILFCLLIGIGLAIFNMSDFQKSKTLLYIKGVNIEADSMLIEIQNIIKCEKFTKVLYFNELPKKYLDYIEKYEEKSGINFSLIEDYAIGDEPWNSSCTFISGIPNRKLNYILYSDNYLIISFMGGGFATSFYHEFIKIDQNSLIPIGFTNNFNQDLLGLLIRIQMEPETIVFEKF